MLNMTAIFIKSFDSRMQLHELHIQFQAVKRIWSFMKDRTDYAR